MIGQTVAQYEILEQLGAGGMGIVYKARDSKLDRTVALKFLPKQFSQDQKSKERFIKEARAASSLDDPNICTVHDIAEAEDGQLFIVMAFYDGSTLKYLLDDRKPSVEEACSIVSQMASGLSAAHDAGIVHRDVKPANVMVTAKGLVKLLDFGVAKLGEGSDLTQEGSTIGTAAYMSPEQARGESVDARSDVWSLGVVLYELLAGSRAFGGGYEAAIAYSIINEAPAPLKEANPDVPEELADVVARCMAKQPDDRMASATDLVEALGPFAGGTRTHVAVSPAVSSGDGASTRPIHRLVVTFSAVAAVVLAALYTAMIVFGLPGWVFPIGVLLMLLGLPIILFSASIERNREALDTGERQQLTGVRAWVTTQRAFQGGILAMGVLLLATAGFVGLRAAGVGPFATLISGGTLTSQDQLIVADFANQTNDPTLGSTVTEAFRIDLSQSTAVRLMDRAAVQSGLIRMEVNPDTSFGAGIALQLAEREGVKAIVDGDINAAGAGFILNARVLSGLDGSQLAAFRENAGDNTDILGAIDRLSAKLREQIGESLVDIRSNDPLEQVTTASIEALRYHTNAENLSSQGKEVEAIEQLELALAEDSLFAMAYRKLAVLLNNTQADRSLREEAATKAYNLRDRLPQRERLLTEAYYHFSVGDDDDAMVRAYEEVLRRYPYEVAALNNLALYYNGKARFAEAEVLLRRALEVSEGTVFRSNLINSVTALGRVDEAVAETEAYERAIPGFIRPAQYRARLAYLQDDFESVDAWLDTALTRANQSFQVAGVADLRNDALTAQGRLRESDRFRQQRNSFYLNTAVRGPDDEPRELDSLGMALDWAQEKAILTGDTREFNRLFEQMQARVQEFGGIPEDDDPYAGIAAMMVRLGYVERARDWVEQHKAWHARSGEEMSDFGDAIEAWVSAREGVDIQGSIEFMTSKIEEFGCRRCFRDVLGELHELNGNSDEAIAAYTTFVSAPGLFEIGSDEGIVALVQFRLGALNEEKGNLDEAITWYSKMAERWKNADAELQPQVAEALRRIESLLDRKAREGS